MNKIFRWTRDAGLHDRNKVPCGLSYVALLHPMQTFTKCWKNKLKKPSHLMTLWGSKKKWWKGNFCIINYESKKRNHNRNKFHSSLERLISGGKIQRIFCLVMKFSHTQNIFWDVSKVHPSSLNWNFVKRNISNESKNRR